MQPIGASSLEHDIAEIFAELPNLQFPQHQYPSLTQCMEANRPAYSYSPALHPNGLEEDIPPQEFNTHIATHSVQVHCSMDFIPYHSYIIGLVTYNKETQTISF